MKLQFVQRCHGQYHVISILRCYVTACCASVPLSLYLQCTKSTSAKFSFRSYSSLHGWLCCFLCLQNYCSGHLSWIQEQVIFMSNSDADVYVISGGNHRFVSWLSENLYILVVRIYCGKILPPNKRSSLYQQKKKTAKNCHESTQLLWRNDYVSLVCWIAQLIVN